MSSEESLLEQLALSAGLDKILNGLLRPLEFRLAEKRVDRFQVFPTGLFESWDGQFGQGIFKPKQPPF